MSPRHDDPMDDTEFEAFLQGRGELADMLRQIPQPAPSAALTEAILDDAEKALAQPASANDAINPDAGNRPSPHFLRRARVPLAFAASIVIVMAISLQWHDQPTRETDASTALAAKSPPMPPQPAAQQAAPPQLVEAPSAPAKPTVATPPAQAVAKRQQDKTSDLALKKAQERERLEQEEDAAKMLAQAEVEHRDSAARAREAAPAAKLAAPLSDTIAAAPPPSPPMPTVAAAPARATAPVISGGLARSAEQPGDETAQTWLDRIDALITQDKRDEALRHWDEFRKVYPTYPVPEKLNAKIKLLKEGR